MFDSKWDTDEWDPGDGLDPFDPVVAAVAEVSCPLPPEEAYAPGDRALGYVDEAVPPRPFEVQACAARLTQLQQQINALQAEQLRVMARLEAQDETREHYAADLVAAILRVAVPTARTRMVRARKLVELLPATLDRVASGAIPAWYADTIAAESMHLPDTAVPAGVRGTCVETGRHADQQPVTAIDSPGRARPGPAAGRAETAGRVG